jgi:Domain of unknown function (DUF4349)
MGSGIAFLEQLEQDFVAIAEREVAQKPPPSRRSIRWKTWLAAAASLLVLAFAIGALAQLAGRDSRRMAAFSTVGSAVNGDGGAVTGRQGSADQHGVFPEPSPGPKGPVTRSSADLSKIVRDGTIALSVPDGSFQTKLARIVAIAHANGGFVLTSQTQGPTTGTLTIRIPASRFDAAIGQIGELGTVESSSVTGKDVTNLYIDYKAHLKNLIGRRTVLRGLMARTTTIGESLTVESELEDVQLQIDQIQGELRFLNDQVAESTLTVDVREASAPAGESQTDGEIQNPSLSRAWDRAVQGFFGIIATIIVGLGYLLPLTVIAGVIFAIVTLVRRRGRAAS